jgi:hypothetical protein
MGEPMKIANTLLAATLLLALSGVNAAVIEIHNYDFASKNPDITILNFETGSTGFSTPSDISISFQVAAAGWYGDGVLQHFASNNIDANTFGLQYLGNVSTYPRTTDITAYFQGTKNFVGAWIAYAPFQDVNTIDFSIYGLSDQILFSTHLSSPQVFADEMYYFGVFSDEAISRAVWHPVEDGYFGLDNLSYGASASPVPAPSAAWLMGSGLLGLVGVALRKAA